MPDPDRASGSACRFAGARQRERRQPVLTSGEGGKYLNFTRLRDRLKQAQFSRFAVDRKRQARPYLAAIADPLTNTRADSVQIVHYLPKCGPRHMHLLPATG